MLGSLKLPIAKQKFAYTMPHPPNEHICCLPFNVNSIIILTEFATADDLQVPVSCRVHLVNSLLDHIWRPFILSDVYKLKCWRKITT